MPIAPTRDAGSPVVLFGIIALGLILGYFSYVRLFQDQQQPIAPVSIPPSDTLSKFRDLKLNFGPFDDYKFQSLRIFGESPVQPGTTGKADIFAPF